MRQHQANEYELDSWDAPTTGMTDDEIVNAINEVISLWSWMLPADTMREIRAHADASDWPAAATLLRHACDDAGVLLKPDERGAILALQNRTPAS